MSRKPARVLVSFRIAEDGLDEVKKAAAEEGVPYTALMRQWIAEGVERHNNGHRPEERKP